MSNAISHRDAGPELPLPRFSLRAMFWMTALVSVVLSVHSTAGILWASFLSLMLLLVGLHVAGAVIGHHLHRSKSVSSAERPPHASADLVRSNWQAPLAGRLQQRRPVGVLMLWIAGLCAIAFGTTGASLLSVGYGARLSWAALALGTAASAVIGALFGFFASSFIRTVRQSWREAARP